MSFLAQVVLRTVLSGCLARVVRAGRQCACLVAATLTSTSLLAAPFAYVPREDPFNDVAIIDTATHQLVKFLAVAGKPRAVGLSPDGAFAYIGGANAHAISVVSSVTNQVVATIEVVGRPEGLAVSPDSKTLWVALDHDKLSLLAIDTLTRKVVATYAGDLKATGIVVSPDGAYVYYVSQQSNMLSMIDSSALKVVAKSVVQNAPSGLAITPGGDQVWA